MKISFNELTIYEIEAFHQKLLKEITPIKNTFTLNFADVQKIDLSNIQLILSLKKYCDDKNIHLKLINIQSKQLKQTFRLFNINERLNLTS